MDITELLMEDHRRVEELFGLFNQTQNPTQRRDIAVRLIAALARHDAAEVQVLYPALREARGVTDEEVQEALDDHREARDKLADLDARLDEVMTADFGERWTELEAEIMGHVTEEEDQLFPALRQAVSQSKLDELGKSVETAKAVAPTHPHMSTPNNAVGASLLGMAMGVTDRAKDAVSGETEQRSTQ